MNNNPIHLNHDEILALIKLIFFTKFESDDLDTLLYAGSPFINSALEKMLRAHPFYQDRLDVLGQISDESLEFVQSKILKDNTANQIDDNILNELINNCIFPYQK